MSQKKVDRYKEKKANRKADMKKAKRKRMAARAAGVVVCAAVLGFIGYSGYQKYTSAQPRTSYEVNYTSVDDYLSELDSEE